MFMTACSFANSKWAHLDDGSHSILRVSMGRIDDNRHQSMSEKEILAVLATNLAITLGVETPPIATRVRRWNQSLAQFPVGHGVRMVEVASALAADAPRLAVAGSYHYGVGIPACIRSGWDAATAIATGLG
jgi:oxygen-dependent protoporphyrinogen oxidase